MLAERQDHRKEAAQPRLSGTESEGRYGRVQHLQQMRLLGARRLPDHRGAQERHHLQLRQVRAAQGKRVNAQRRKSAAVQTAGRPAGRLHVKNKKKEGKNKGQRRSGSAEELAGPHGEPAPVSGGPDRRRDLQRSARFDVPCRAGPEDDGAQLPQRKQFRCGTGRRAAAVSERAEGAPRGAPSFCARRGKHRKFPFAGGFSPLRRALRPAKIKLCKARGARPREILLLGESL